MVANTLLVTIAVLQGYLFWLLGELKFLISYKGLLFHGFNIFRRFRITHLQKTECPEVLRHFWSGHAPKHVSERCTKLREERDFRLEWIEKTGLGFELPPSIGQLGLLRIVPKVA